MEARTLAVVISFPIQLQIQRSNLNPFFLQRDACVLTSNGLVEELQLMDRLLHTQHKTQTQQQWATGQEAAADSLK
jgi:hypothetical protein